MDDIEKLSLQSGPSHLREFCLRKSEADQVTETQRNSFSSAIRLIPIGRSRGGEIPRWPARPESNDPTQWLFHGRPEESTAPLQVAVARLLGYRWPAELDDKMRLSKRARTLVKRCEELAKFAADDGIVCIPSVRGKEPAAIGSKRCCRAPVSARKGA